MASLAWPDIVALVLYFLIVMTVGLFATFRADTTNAEGYFLAGKKSNWFLIGTSLFSTNVGTPMFIGMSGTAAATGIAVTMFEWHAMVIMVALGWIFVPVYRASGCFTMPQYLQLRYGGERIRMSFAILGVVLSIIWYISSHMYTGAVFIQQILSWNMYVSVLLILGVCAAYTIIGGLTAVMWTDAIQTIVMMGGAIALCVIGLVRVGGWPGILEKYPLAAANYTKIDYALYGNHTCGLPRPDWNHIFRSAESMDYPWPGMVFGLTILALFVWCNDQISVQRVLSAKSIVHAKVGVCLSANLKILSFVAFTLPGLISRILFPEEVACADPAKCEEICGNPRGCINIAYPLLVNRILPSGLRGLMLAAVMAGLMSSLTSIFNSSSTLFTMDIYRKLRPASSNTELMVVGRVFILLLVGVSIAWLPLLEELQGSSIWDYLVSLASYLFPPYVAAFVMGLCWTRTTETGAFYGIVLGIAVSLVRLGLDWSRAAPPCGSSEPDNRFPIVTKVHFMHFAVIDFVFSCLVMITVSIMTKPRTKEQLRRVTFWTRNDDTFQELDGIAMDESTKICVNETKKQTGSQESKETEDKSGFINILKRYVCGINQTEPQMTPAQIQELQKQSMDIQESTSTRWALNGLACFTVATCVVLHVYFR